MFKASILSFSLMLLLITSPFANALQGFDAEFGVRLMGVKIGNVDHKMQCHQNACTLTSEAIPPRWARRFINESSVETVQLRVNEQQLEWQSYNKKLERRYSDRVVQIETDFIYDAQTNRIHYPQKDRTWEAKPNTFDLISIAYALQFYAQKNPNRLPELTLQEEDQQQTIQFRVENKKTRVHLDYKSNLDARFYEWETEEHHIKIWLIEELNLFPGRIDVYNKRVDRRLRLVLNQAPKLH